MDLILSVKLQNGDVYLKMSPVPTVIKWCVTNG